MITQGSPTGGKITKVAHQIRGLDASDQAGLLDMFGRCSPDSLYARFLTYSPSAARDYVASVFTDSRCYSAVIERRQPGLAPEIVAEGSLFFQDTRTAELALLVLPGYQQRGLGVRLAAHLCHYAAHCGIDQLEISALTSNAKMIRLFGKVATAIEFSYPDAGVMTLTGRLRQPCAGQPQLFALAG